MYAEGPAVVYKASWRDFFQGRNCSTFLNRFFHIFLSRIIPVWFHTGGGHYSSSTLLLRTLHLRMEEIMKMILAAVFALSCLSAVRLPAQTLNWSTPAKYGTGTEPSVSMN